MRRVVFRSFNSAVVLLGSRTISTGATAGNITFDSTVRATTAFTETLGLTAGTGTITFTGAVGDNNKQLGDVTVTSAGTVNVDNAFNAKSLTANTNVGVFDSAAQTITTTQANANSGAVNIATAGALTVGDIVTDGGAAAVNSVGKNAGTVTLNAGTLLTTAQISAKGSAAESTDLATRAGGTGNSVDRSEERRVGKGGRSRRSGGGGE